MAGLLRAFRNPAVQVVCGGTYISLEGLYSKAVALFWFFPLREEGDGLCQTDQFFANNIAFRREVFESNPFPCLPQYRGQCVALAGQLKERGIPIFRQRSARVSHPPPNGLRHFICRALIAGHDAVIEGKRHSKDGGPQFASCYWIYWRYRESLGSSFSRIRRHYRDVGLGRMGLVGAAAIACCYYTLKLAGELLTILQPELVRRYFAI